MFSMGLSLRLKDFTAISKFPKAFGVGFFLQVVSLPAIAFLIAYLGIQFLGLSPEIAVGIVIIAACPGGVTSNLFVHMSKGNTALSIALTSVISIASVLTIPFIVNLGFATFMGTQNETALPIAKTIMGIFVITTVPVLIGMLIKAKSENFVLKFEPIAAKLATVLFAIIILGAIASKWTLLSKNFATIGPITLLFNLTTLAVAIFAAKALALKMQDRIAIVFECGLQNGTLALMITLTFLNNENMMLPGGLYSILMFITGGVYFIWARGKKLKREEATPVTNFEAA